MIKSTPDNEMTAFRSRWTARRDELRQLHALVDGADLCDMFLGELDALLRDSANQLLSLREAAIESGYSADHLGRLIRGGKLPNAGRSNAPKIRRGDLPRKAAGLQSRPFWPTVIDSKRQIALACVEDGNG